MNPAAVQIIERAAREAAEAQFGLDVRETCLLNHGENTTFRVDAVEGTYLLRVQRAGYQTAESTRSEHAWLRALSDDGFVVPRPLPTIRGDTVATVHPRYTAPRLVCMFRWTHGDFSECELTDAQILALGRLLAGLHAYADRWAPPPGFTRQIWDADGLLGGIWGDPLAAPGLDASDRAVLEEACARITAELDEARPEVGLIHADLHPGNLLWRDADPCPIDFDDCGVGYRAHDLLIARYALPDGEAGRALFDRLLEAYAEIRAVPDLAVLPTIRVAFGIRKLGWLHTRSVDVPRFVDVLRESMPRVLEQVRRYLSA